MLEAPIISWDLETQSDAKGKTGNMEDWHPHSRIVSVSVTTQDGTWVTPLSHPDGPWVDKWKVLYHNYGKAMLKSGAKLVAHNGKYEVRWTHTMVGLKLEDRLWWDTMMSAYLLDENLPANLKDTAVRDLGVDPWSDVDLRDPEAVPWDSLALYNARDTDYAYRLVDVHKVRLTEEARLGRLFHFEGMPIIRRLAKMERVGLPLDVERVKTMMAESKAIVAKGTEHLMAIAVEHLGMIPENYPTVSFGSTNKFFKDFMERSGVPVITLTPTGNPSWDADNLETAADLGYDIAKEIKEVRLHSNRISKFFTPWLRVVDENGRLHPSFNPMLVDDKWEKPKGTKTGRLSSSGQLNAQQIARDLKICYGGEPSWLMAELDYSQIELRIAAHLAKIERVIEAYRNGEDLHILMAAAIRGCDPSEVTGDDRQKGKAGNFGFLYEMGEQTYIDYARKNYKVFVDLKEAKLTRRTFFDVQWPGLGKWHEQQKNLARRNGFVRNPIGRKRRLPEIYNSDWASIGRAERRAINSPIQSFAADLMCLALIEIGKRTDPEQVRLVGTVHDSLLAQVREHRWEQDVAEMAAIMLDPGLEKKFGVKLTVPLAVEAHVGYHWKDPEGVTRVYDQARLGN